MPILYARRSASGTLEPEENVLVWFGKPAIKDCDHAMVLYGGNLVFLKTVETISQERLIRLAGDDLKWQETFGTGQASNELHEAVLESRKVNEWG